jgi:hypothetical protein
MVLILQWRKTLLTVVSSFLFLYGHSQSFEGFFDFRFEESTGKMLLKLPALDQEFLLVNAYGTGLGSNDIGMDRGKLIDTRIVKWQKQGDRILLVQPNTFYRAQSTTNAAEKASVAEAFAFSVLYGTKIEKTENGVIYIDIAPFLMDDVNMLAQALKDQKQGSFKLEKSRSAIFLDNTHAFPDNCEFESILTFTGEATGRYLRSVTPTPEAVSFRQHISFIRLPDANYRPRAFHPESGYFYLNFYDYSTPIHSPLEKRYITRHRLIKKNPDQAISDPVKPLIYYVDPGCPEPIKTALIVGGKWWAQAFEAAGFSNAFDVEELPTNAHPLDVRYNMIQWVHRSTRGWSYGSSITDPRTGEIIKGHVSLGSLRVRQDFLLAQGILSPYKNDMTDHVPMTEMALHRLQQLSAHEIGHTIGLAHNFAASINDRASVMDYPHPLITLKEDGSLDFSKDYDQKIGIWDKRSIMYGYTQFTSDAAEEDGLQKIIQGNLDQGLHYLTDEDGRGPHTSSAITHLWDNGADPQKELNRIVKLRKHCIDKFGMDNIPQGTPVSELEKVFVPLYYMHRYQTEAVAKLIGGYEYSYHIKGFKPHTTYKSVDQKVQQNARANLLSLIQEKYLVVPQRILDLMPPPAYGYPRNRESFTSSADPGFDATSVHESASGQIIELLLHPARMQRLYNQNLLTEHLAQIKDHFTKSKNDKVAQTAECTAVIKLRLMTINEDLSHGLRSTILEFLNNYVTGKLPQNLYIVSLLTMDYEQLKAAKSYAPPALPPGQPIGSCSFE